MRKLIGLVASASLLAASAAFGAAPAQADTCTLVQSEYIYNGANVLTLAQGLEGCSGDVYYEIQGSWDSETGPWVVQQSGTAHYDDEEEQWILDGNCLPLWVRVHAEFGSQEKTTHAAINNNAGTC